MAKVLEPKGGGPYPDEGGDEVAGGATAGASSPELPEGVEAPEPREAPEPDGDGSSSGGSAGDGPRRRKRKRRG